MAGWRAWPGRRIVVVGLLAAGGIAMAVVAAIGVAQEHRLRADGVEVVAEVLGERTNRSLTSYHTIEVGFTTPGGRSVETTVATQQTPSLPVLDVRYDPDHPTRVEAVDDPAPLWLEDALAAVGLGVVALLVAVAPRLRRWRDGITSNAEP